jgi:hypothetical protein
LAFLLSLRRCQLKGLERFLDDLEVIVSLEHSLTARFMIVELVRPASWLAHPSLQCCQLQGLTSFFEDPEIVMPADLFAAICSFFMFI